MKTTQADGQVEKLNLRRQGINRMQLSFIRLAQK